MPSKYPWTLRAVSEPNCNRSPNPVAFTMAGVSEAPQRSVLLPVAVVPAFQLPTPPLLFPITSLMSGDSWSRKVVILAGLSAEPTMVATMPVMVASDGMLKPKFDAEMMVLCGLTPALATEPSACAAFARDAHVPPGPPDPKSVRVPGSRGPEDAAVQEELAAPEETVDEASELTVEDISEDAGGFTVTTLQ